MKVQGLALNSSLGHRAQRLMPHAQLMDDLECTSIVHVDHVALGHHGSDKNFRPYIHLLGELRETALYDGATIGDQVTSVVYVDGEGPRVDGFYEFDDDQLADLVRKGYFREGFDVPAMELSGFDYYLPTRCTMLVMEPASEHDVPLVFTENHGLRDLGLDENNSGYDLVEYFTDHRVDERELSDVVAHQAEVDDMFAGVALDEAELAQLPGRDVEAPVAEEQPVPIVDQMAAEEPPAQEVPVEAPEAGSTEPELSSMDPDDIYRTMIDPHVSHDVDFDQEPVVQEPATSGQPFTALAPSEPPVDVYDANVLPVDEDDDEEDAERDNSEHVAAARRQTLLEQERARQERLAAQQDAHLVDELEPDEVERDDFEPGV